MISIKEYLEQAESDEQSQTESLGHNPRELVRLIRWLLRL
jgi:hypothetical protein